MTPTPKHVGRHVHFELCGTRVRARLVEVRWNILGKPRGFVAWAGRLASMPLSIMTLDGPPC